MKNTLLIVLVIWASSCTSTKKNNTTNQTSMSTQNTTTQSKSFYDFSIAKLDENGAINMADYKGKKILIVNVASKCGYTPQYEGLQKLYTEHGDKVQIIGFPCNQFMGQEPGGKEDIASFCQKNYGVTFPLTTKIDVKGKDHHAIYEWLTSKVYNGIDDYKVGWNFNKFLLDENGKLISHYDSSVTPMSEELVNAILK
jgi:glutathione peroxidase